MSNFEGFQDDKTFLNNFTVPTAAMRSGDFSAFATPLLDPATCTVAGGVRSCQTFPGNRIPANRIHPTSQDLLEFYPEPNAAGTSLNYLSQVDRVIDRKQYTQRMDFNQSSALNWMGRYSWSHDDEVTPALKLNGSKLLNTVHQLMIGNTYTLSPTVLNEFRFGYNSFFNTFGRELAFVRDVVEELGIPGVSTGPPESWGIPTVGISGYSGFGDNTEGPYTNRNKVFEFTDNLSWFRGTHSFKAGASIRFDQYNQVGNQFSRGSFAFDGRATGSAIGNATAGAPAFADMLLGYMRTSESAVALARTEFRSISQAYYFTDTWRMRENMTLDLGIRYEYIPPWLDEGGTLVNTFLPYHDTGMPVADLSRHPVLVRIGEGDFYEDSPIRFAPNIQTARDGRMGGRLVNDDKKNFAPRIGWAWTPSANWSVRAGAGVFYMQDTGNPRFDMARNAVGRRQDVADPLLLNLNWNAPFLGTGSNVCGVQPPLVCVQNHYAYGNMYDRKTPYMVQYVFNVQRELDANTAFEIGYLGSRSKRLERMFDANEVTPGPGTLASRRPYPEFTKVQEIGNVAEAKYNSLAMKLTRRLNRGFSVLVGYTLAKSEDNGSGIRVLNGDALFPQNSNCFECEWGLSIFDVRHRFVTTLLYELPFGEGKRWANSGPAGAVLGGWQVSADRQQVQRLPQGRGCWRRRAQHRSPDLPSEPGVRPGSQRWATDGAAVVQHRRVRAPRRVHLRERRAQHRHRTGHLQHRPGDLEERHVRWRQERAVAAGSLQPVQQADLGRPGHEHVQFDLRPHHHHALADARAAARREIRVLSTVRSGLQACTPEARRTARQGSTSNLCTITCR